ncbi:uncharacterized protein LOC130691721 [Daphnia carinata]|uniref:uncharacterized protein LOC130691721 n=1 Tax=Daphnia carinata TaxID=120202 RepID=UPI00257DA87E|nr:uncharacterized protein LOC130691721 [Daphnia carinata]
MDLTKEELSKKFELLEDDVPVWATSLFEKMKAEICAEVHAKVAYSMRIMLDQFHEDLKLSLQSLQVPIKDDVCFCKEIDSCKEKYAVLCASHHVMAKEEKKRIKRLKKEEKKINKQQKNVSESDTDNEKNTEVSFTTVNLPVPAQKYDPTKAPPVPPRKTSPKKTSVTSPVSSPSDVLSQLNDDIARNTELLAHITDGLNMDRQELINGSVGTLNIEEHTFELQMSTEGQYEFAMPQGETKESLKEEKLKNERNPVTEAVETVFSPSDSEFEVISMPHNIRAGSEYTPLPGDTSALMSDYDDSSSDGFNSETEHEFKDCKQPSPDVFNNLQPSGSLYPELELKKMSLSLMSSTTSTLLDGYVPSSSTDGAVALKSTVIEIERERAPYSVPPEDVEKINSQEIVHNQPLPSEFLRDRKPYTHVPLEEPKQPPPQSPQQQTQVPKVSRPSQQNQRDSTYRVDNIPESFWDEAMTVAAHTYNAAKSAVGTLADTFVPGVAAQGVSSSPQPRNSPVRIQPAYRVEMAEKEQKLFEMGFLDHGLNATLLVRHNGDMDRVIAELIEP